MSQNRTSHNAQLSSFFNGLSRGFKTGAMTGFGLAAGGLALYSAQYLPHASPADLVKVFSTCLTGIMGASGPVVAYTSLSGIIHASLPATPIHENKRNLLTEGLAKWAAIATICVAASAPADFLHGIDSAPQAGNLQAKNTPAAPAV